MSLPFALRSRLKLRDESPRAPASSLPPFAVPVAAYWVLMGLLTYGVASGALRPERLAALRLLPERSFTSGRLPPEPAPDDDVGQRPRRDVPAGAPATPTNAAPSEPAPTSSPPVAEVESAAPAGGAPEPSENEPERLARAGSPPVVRPLAGFTLGAPYEDGDGDRGSSYEEPRARRAEEQVARARRFDDGEPVPRRTDKEDVRTARLARRDPLLDREWKMPDATEFQPATRRTFAAHAPEGSRSSRGAARRAPGDPYPGFSVEDDGPRSRSPVRSLPSRSSDDSPRSPAPSLPPPTSASSCEAALASANEEMDLTKAQSSTPDVTRGAYAAVLDRGTYLTPCGVPAGMTLDVCVAIRDGRAVGVTVSTSPADARVRSCVRNAIAAIAFPRSPRLDVTRTRFDRGR